MYSLLMLEIGHALDDDAAGVMEESFPPGTRRLPTVVEVAAVGAVAVPSAAPTPQDIRVPSAWGHGVSAPSFGEMDDGNLLAALSAFLEKAFSRR